MEGGEVGRHNDDTARDSAEPNGVAHQEGNARSY